MLPGDDRAARHGCSDLAELTSVSLGQLDGDVAARWVDEPLGCQTWLRVDLTTDNARMQHLRLIVPPASAEPALAYLTGEAAVVNVVVLRGAALKPPGDVVLCDVAREAATAVLGRLRDLGVESDGSIAMQAVDLSLSDAAREAEKSVPGYGTDAVVWEEIEQRTEEESSLSVTYLGFMVIATLIAACAVLLDSPVLVVGAMVVGPEFGALAGICVGIVKKRRDEVVRSTIALVVGFVVGIVVTMGVMWLLDAIGVIDSTVLDNSRPLTQFIRQPDALSFVIAFLAGVAGTMSLTSAKSGALIGVLISVTTIPAAGDAAVSLVFGYTSEAGRSMLQLLLNLAGIIVASLMTLYLQQAFWRRADRRR